MSLKSWLAKSLLKLAIGGKTMDWLNGKKTYLTMIVIIVLGVIDAWNGYCGLENTVPFCFNINIPEVVYIVLAALGIYTRSVVKPK